MTTGEQVIIFGGTFDPPHIGHQQCIDRALTRFPDAHLLVIPAKAPPAGSGAVKKPHLSFAERVQMCRLAFTDGQARMGRVEVSEIEGQIPAPNYTLATVRTLSANHPNTELFLLLGEDQVGNLPNWHQPLELLALVSLIVISRSATADKQALRALVKSTLDALSLTLVTGQTLDSAIIVETKRPIFFLNASGSTAESRVIRSSLQNGTVVPENWISPAVIEYIKTRNLY